MENYVEIKVQTMMKNGNLDAIRFNKLLTTTYNKDSIEYCFDFNRFNDCKPFTILLVAESILQFKSKHQTAKFSAKMDNMKSFSYLCHMGFFQYIGISVGKSPNESHNSKSCFPIKTISFDEMSLEEAYKEIEHHADQLALIVENNIKSDLFEVMKYSIIEMVRNSIEHSEKCQVSICGQRRNDLNTVEFAIFDRGIGIEKSMKSLRKVSNPPAGYNFLEYSLFPGISALSNIKLLDKGNSYINSGYGLFYTSEICKQFEGGFILISYNDAILVSSKNKLDKFKCYYEGTGVQVRIKTDITKSLKNIIKEINTNILPKYKNAGLVKNKPSRSSGGLKP
ncbi:MAG: hypothetical protein PHY42_03015 [Bacilli bacterium]|nr:hypothetical protein [Bacilli bacterium]